MYLNKHLKKKNYSSIETPCLDCLEKVMYRDVMYHTAHVNAITYNCIPSKLHYDWKEFPSCSQISLNIAK